MVMEARYVEKDLEEFVGNPYIAALPPDVDPGDYASRLVVAPPYGEADRGLPKERRLKLLTRISNLHVPTTKDTDIAQNFERCLCWGYACRNPMPFDVVRQALEERGFEADAALEDYLTGYLSPAYGFPVFGISGVGKTCSVMNVAKKYDQVIRHRSYRGVPFDTTQLVWLRVECPGDGTPKGLCTAIFQAVDEAMCGETGYVQEFVGNGRVSRDLMILKAGAVVKSLGLGVLIIDDIQNLHGAKASVSAELLSFLINLMENIKVPVVMVGTPKILEVLQKEFQQAKRATGEGAINMELLGRESVEWENLIGSVWRFQYTRTAVPLTDELRKAFYEETVGNPFLVAILYKLVQDDAIISEREEFDAGDVRRVARARLGITAGMRRNMLAGVDEELTRYKRFWTAAPVPAAPASRGRKPSGGPTRQDLKVERLRGALLEELAGALAGEAPDDAVLRDLADRAVFGNPGCDDPQRLLQYAVSLHEADLAARRDEEGLLGPADGDGGYGDLEGRGLAGGGDPFRG